jgi:hypothetical protein
VARAEPSDSGTYRCVALNEYSQAFAVEVISVEGMNHLTIFESFSITVHVIRRFPHTQRLHRQQKFRKLSFDCKKQFL